MKKVFSILVIVLLAFALVACNKEDAPGPGRPPVQQPDGFDISTPVTLRTMMWENLGRNSSGFLATAGAGAPAGGVYTSQARDPQGNPYVIAGGEALPVWRRMGEMANITFTRGAGAAVGDMNNAAWWDQVSANPDMLREFDLVAGSAGTLNEHGVAGRLVNLLPFIEDGHMPNFADLLDDRPDFKGDLLQADAQGHPAIYVTPYFDGLDEIEHMFLVRVDWVRSILDADLDAFTGWPTTPVVVPTGYTPVNPTGAHSYSAFVSLDDQVRQINKSRTENIIVTLRNLVNPTPRQLIETFRQYVADTWGGTLAQPSQGYRAWSDVFISQDASYDTDEMIALMYVMDANFDFLNRNATPGVIDEHIMWFPRSLAGNRVNMYVRAFEIFGLPGVQSRNGQNIFFDSTGEVHDIRAMDIMVDSINNLATLQGDGLIMDPTVATSWWPALGANPSDSASPIMPLLQSGNAGPGGTRRFGFMIYDFNATQTAAANLNPGIEIDPDHEFRAILPPLVNWDTGMTVSANGLTITSTAPEGQYMHFTQSMRAMRADSWGIVSYTLEGASDDTALLRTILLMDQLFNYTTPLTVTNNGEDVAHDETFGIVNLFGPKEYHDGYDTTAAGFRFPLFNDETRAMFTRDGGHINTLRRFIGATNAIGHVRDMSLEYQTLTEQGREGIDMINRAMLAGTFVFAGRPEWAASQLTWVNGDNPFFHSAPSMLPFTADMSLAMTGTTFRNFTFTNIPAMRILVLRGYSSDTILPGQVTPMTAAAFRVLVRRGTEYSIYIDAIRSAFEIRDLLIQGTIG